MPASDNLGDDPAVRQFNEMVASWTTPEAAEKRAEERAEYERRYAAMMARKRRELESAR